MGVNALRNNLGKGVSTKEARSFLNKYFEKYPRLAKWIDETKAEAARKGYTETLFGRRRYFEGINSHIPYIRASAERMAINAPIQGTQADIIKMAMHKIDSFLKEKLKDTQDESVRLVLQIHDELIYEIKTGLEKDLEKEIKEIMENILDREQSRDVPIITDVKMGKNWGEME
jgi:DNA polymerase-1